MNKPGHSPVTVGALRGVLVAAIIAGIDALIVVLSSSSWGDLAPYQPLAILAARTIEGVIDKTRGQVPQRVLGSHPAYID